MNSSIKNILISTILYFIFSYYPCSSMVLSFNYYVFKLTLNTHLFIYYQQPGDAKNPYLAQYSAVTEDSPVRVS